MFDGTFEQATILRTGSEGLTRVIVRSSWAERESILVEAYEAELLVSGGRSFTSRRGGSSRTGKRGRVEGASGTHEAQQWFPYSTSNWLKRLFRVANKCPSPKCPSPSELVNDCQHATLVLGSDI